MKTVTTAETREKLQGVPTLVGTPKLLVTDATSFKNTPFPKYLDKWKIDYHYVTPGKVELV